MGSMIWIVLGFPTTANRPTSPPTGLVDFSPNSLDSSQLSSLLPDKLLCLFGVVGEVEGKGDFLSLDLGGFDLGSFFLFVTGDKTFSTFFDSTAISASAFSFPLSGFPKFSSARRFFDRLLREGDRS